MNKSAFTLAEILITLGIIGVVAALTISQLVQNYKQNSTATKLQSTVSMLNQALIRASEENGTPDTWGLTGYETDIVDVYLKPYLNIVKEYKPSNTTSKRYVLNNGTIISYALGGPYNRRGIFYIYVKDDYPNYTYGKTVFTFNLYIEGSRYSVTSTRDHSSYSLCDHFTKSKLSSFCLGNTGKIGYAPGIGCSALIECNGWKFPKEYPIKL